MSKNDKTKKKKNSKTAVITLQNQLGLLRRTQLMKNVQILFVLCVHEHEWTHE